jgi:membrane associated rhomboid family serine protease
MVKTTCPCGATLTLPHGHPGDVVTTVCPKCGKSWRMRIAPHAPAAPTPPSDAAPTPSQPATPWATWAIAAFLAMAGAWFILTLANEQGRQNIADFMLWCGREGNQFYAQPPGRIYLDYQTTGEFHTYQLLTYGLIHAGTVDLAISILLVLIVGARINRALGNIFFIPACALLTVIAGATQYLATRGAPPIPVCGSAGLVMGLVGMYAVLYPTRAAHSADWPRAALLQIAGLWLVPVAVMLIDMLPPLLGMQTNATYWAQAGGFVLGCLLAMPMRRLRDD